MPKRYPLNCMTLPATLIVEDDGSFVIEGYNEEYEMPWVQRQQSWTPCALIMMAQGATQEDLDEELVEYVRTGDIELAGAFIALGADVNGISERGGERAGSRALHYAASRGHTDMIHMLLKAGANPSIKNDFGDTPLHIAVGLWEPETVSLLIDAGADTNAKNQQGETPLHWAARHGFYTIAHQLLEAGANGRTEEKIFGYTPLEMAEKYGHKDVVELLEDWT